MFLLMQRFIIVNTRLRDLVTLKKLDLNLYYRLIFGDLLIFVTVINSIANCLTHSVFFKDIL